MGKPYMIIKRTIHLLVKQFKFLLSVMSEPNLKKAEKILCIGGSTLNPNTLKNLRDALIQTEFLEEWTVIFANHTYFKLKSLEESIRKVYTDFDGLEVIPVYENSLYKIEKGKIYIIPDPKFSDIMVDVKFDVRGCIPVLKVTHICNSSFEEMQQTDTHRWMCEIDASGVERTYLPCIDKIMYEIANSKLTKFAGIVLCGLEGDGANGLQAIVSQGGMIAVQEPSECCHPIRGRETSSMPNVVLQLEPKCRRISLENQQIETISDWLIFLKADEKTNKNETI